MRNFQDTFETCKRSFTSTFSICMTVSLFQKIHLPLKVIFSTNELQKRPKFYRLEKQYFGTKCCSNCSRAVFMMRLYFFLQKSESFWNFPVFSKE